MAKPNRKVTTSKPTPGLPSRAVTERPVGGGIVVSKIGNVGLSAKDRIIAEFEASGYEMVPLKFKEVHVLERSGHEAVTYRTKWDGVVSEGLIHEKYSHFAQPGASKKFPASFDETEVPDDTYVVIYRAGAGPIRVGGAAAKWTEEAAKEIRFRASKVEGLPLTKASQDEGAVAAQFAASILKYMNDLAAARADSLDSDEQISRLLRGAVEELGESQSFAELVALNIASLAERSGLKIAEESPESVREHVRAALETLDESSSQLALAAEALGPALFEAAPGASPQLARSVQARENFYDTIADRFELLTSTEAGKRMGSVAARPGNAAIQARETGRLVALQRGRNLMFPGFQFAPDLTVLPVIADLRTIAEENERTEVGLVEWLCAPNTQFDGHAPAEFLANDPERVVSVAANSFAVSW